MNNPFKVMPELRATFQTDAGALIHAAGAQLVNLGGDNPDFSLLPALRNSIHTLRGASAMVGAKTLTLLIDDYERLIEVADSFKLSARDKAQTVFSFLEKHLGHIKSVIEATLDGNDETARERYGAFHQKVLQSWGDYFYSAPADVPDDSPVAPHSSELKKTHKVSKHAAPPRASNDAIAREFLSSLGVAPTPATLQAPVASDSAAQTQAQTKPHSRGPAKPSTTEAEQIDPDMLSYFVLETSESLAQLEALLLSWEKNHHDQKIAHSIFRLVHTIKGAANSLGLIRIGRLLHGLEDLLETHVVDRPYAKLPELIEICFGVADTVKAFVHDTQTGHHSPANADRANALSQRIALLAAEVPMEDATPVCEAPAEHVAPSSPEVLAHLPAAPVPEEYSSIPQNSSPESAREAHDRADHLEHQTIRVESDRLELLMNLIGELLISRSRLEKKLSDISRLKDEMSFGKTRLFQAITDFQAKYEYSHEYSRRALERNRLDLHSAPESPVIAQSSRPPSLETGEELLGGFSDLEFDQYDDFNILARTLMEIGTDTGEIFSQLNRFFDAFGEETNQFSKITSRLQDEITRVRMMPLTLLFRRLQRSARDASHKERKSIEFVTTGSETRLDKLILDKLYTPLLHIVRNAVSHGIETAEERQKAGKPASGRIGLMATCETNQVVIEVRDDGGGLKLDQIRATAIARGLIPPEAQVDDDTLIQFIFAPGFSTAANVTDVSGRGVGLDVVRLEISRLSGSVQVRSIPGQGCSFTIRLPLTLAINQAMFIEVGKDVCALPLNFVERVQECTTNDLATSGTQELVHTPEGLVPLIRLHRLLGAEDHNLPNTVVLARIADRHIAIGVDRILRKQDIVVKSLGPLLRGHHLFSGATLGGDGQVVLIIDLPRLLENEKTDIILPSQPREVMAGSVSDESQKKPLILVVDDSLSVRKVIEKHLLSLDYRVELAVDGLDALEKLRLQKVALVLTDLEMPRMHGFELVAEMRRQNSMRAIPIIVVTSRDAEKHRRHAESLGVNDYITKPFTREQLARCVEQHLLAAAHHN